MVNLSTNKFTLFSDLEKEFYFEYYKTHNSITTK